MRISDELIACYVEGLATAEECKFVREYLSRHPEEFERVVCLMDHDSQDYLDERSGQATHTPLNMFDLSATTFSTAAFAPCSHGHQPHIAPQAQQQYIHKEDDLLSRLNEMYNHIDKL